MFSLHLNFANTWIPRHVHYRWLCESLPISSALHEYRERPNRLIQNVYCHSIHSYKDRFTIRKINWPLMSLQLLQWLEPREKFKSGDDENNVDWEAERNARNISSELKGNVGD